MNRAPLSYWTAYLQSAVALIFLLGYFAMMGILFLGWAQIPDNLLELAKTLAIALTNAMGLLFAFLYLRSRQDGPPDPSTTTTTQTTQTVTKPTTPETTSHAQPTPPSPTEPPVVAPAPERVPDTRDRIG
jgi:hypothetical protein